MEQNEKTRDERIKLDKLAYTLMLGLSIILIILYSLLIHHITVNFNPNNKIPILASIFTTCTLILLNLPEPIYYLTAKVFKKIDINIYKEEYKSNLMFLKITGIAMAIFSTLIYCIVLAF